VLGGLSSRLFQEVREKRGLAYAIDAFHWPFSDCGVFGIGAGTAPEDVGELVEVALACLRQAVGGRQRSRGRARPRPDEGRPGWPRSRAPAASSSRWRGRCSSSAARSRARSWRAGSMRSRWRMCAPPAAACSATSRRIGPLDDLARRPNPAPRPHGGLTAMALFRFPSEPPTRPLIRTQNLYLRAPQASDYAAWAVLRMESRDFLTPWEPTWNEDDLTRASFRLRAKRAARDLDRRGLFAVHLRARTETLLGGLTLGLIRRGVAQACTLGYWMGERHAGKGHMTEAVRGALCASPSRARAAPRRGRLPAEQRAVAPPAGARRLPA
jgi:hypothetical protein